jgi:hypothetical protein
MLALTTVVGFGFIVAILSRCRCRIDRHISVYRWRICMSCIPYARLLRNPLFSNVYKLMISSYLGAKESREVRSRLSLVSLFFRPVKLSRAMKTVSVCLFSQSAHRVFCRHEHNIHCGFTLISEAKSSVSLFPQFNSFRQRAEYLTSSSFEP